jgi:hypothetical protein
VTVTAPPRPPATGDPVDWGDPEALITEARQRAWRRRRRYAAAVAVLALLATSVIVVFGRPEPPQSLSPEPPPTLLVPPDPDDAALIVAKFGKIHVGWVLVYADGRVIEYGSNGQCSDCDERSEYAGGDLFERRLTANGLNLVRSGTIPPRFLLSGRQVYDPAMPADTWADPEFKPYLPSRYAACFDPGNPEEIVGRLPAAARPLLRGKELRTHSNIDPYFPDLAWPPAECFEPSTEEAIVLYKTLRRAGFAFEWSGGEKLVPADEWPPPWERPAAPAAGSRNRQRFRCASCRSSHTGSTSTSAGDPQRLEPTLLAAVSRAEEIIRRLVGSEVAGRLKKAAAQSSIAVARDAVVHIRCRRP